MKFGTQYQQLWGVSDPGQKKNVHYWQSSLGYNLDEHGHAAITATYRHARVTCQAMARKSATSKPDRL
ncbi:MAG: hypothetical protein WDN48_13715 [Pseudolabrys sp.]